MNCGAAIWDRLLRGEVKNLLFNYFEGLNEGIVNRDAERRGSMVKCRVTPLEEEVGGMCWCYGNYIHEGKYLSGI